MDESGNFMGVAAKELQEETGISIKQEEMINLGSMYVSPGGSDEEMMLFAVEISMSKQELEKIINKIHGDSDHEQILLEIVEYNPKNVLDTRDSKLMTLSYAYDNYLKNK